uniref:EGF-like domain-containing protein n=1 Tax=Ciona intestinalis TaxID=7719 RepID=F6PUJ2_CIOIN
MVKIGRFCRDVNECTHSPCDSNQYCINSRGSYHCRCKAGYSDAGDGSCVDTDECAQGMCQALGETCRNTVGSYECVCDRGFTKDPTTNGRYCMDVNECDLDMCSENSECINTQGSYFCRCHRGYTKHQAGVCVDNQECSLGEGNKCQWRCRNTPGAFECECPVGYDKLDYSCNDINECDRGASVCGPSDTCVNTRGGHKCMKQITCPDNNFYRRKRCRRVTSNNETFAQCKAQSLSISYHYIDIPTGLKLPSNLLKISFSPRRRRQQYHFQIAQGEENAFSLRQPSMYRPQAYLVLTGELTGPSEHMVKVDISTYNRRGEMRDNRMLTITVFVSEYTF